jgi:diguanylate cyclase (GGDEF)-like protein/PAS domain S-box-containing protein
MIESKKHLGTPSAAEWLVGGGEMAKLIKVKDWSTTALGPIETWPQSLRSVVGLAQASNSPISLIWGPGHVQIYNDGYWPICGEKHPTAMGQDFRECWAEAWPVIGASYESALAGKTSYLEKTRIFLDRYGFMEETWFTFSFSPITDESGKVGGLFHPVTEMTSQMLSERRTRTLRDLAERAGRVKTSDEVFALSAQILAESDLDLPFVVFYLVDADAPRAQLVAQTGLPAGNMACPIVCPKEVNLESPDTQPWPIGEVVQHGRAHPITDLTQHLTGTRVGPYEENPRQGLALPIVQPGSERPSAVMLAGVSSRLILDEAYRGFYDLVAAAVSASLANARAYEDARKKAEALAEIDRAKTTFFSNVSHEFRTPITLMLGPLEDELKEQVQPLPRERRDRLEMVHRNARRLLKLVNSLLDFSRIEAGRSEASYVPTDLAELTAGLASTFRSAMERGGLRLDVDCATLPEPVFVNREMWEKIVLNLLSNAFKHTLKGSVSVKLAWQGDRVTLSIADTGVGIAATELPKLFQRFHRVQGAVSRTHEGTGIGLSLVRELVALHGGDIRAESQEGVGSRFTVSIPTGKAHLPADKLGAAGSEGHSGRSDAYVEEALQWLASEDGLGQAPGTPDLIGDAGAPASVAPGKSEARPRIVWADDNADMRKYVAQLLADEFEVLSVPDGVAALDAVQAALPDLVLSDVMMPKLDGFGLLRALRADPRTEAVPVILLSARAGEDESMAGLQAGADDYLAKPFSARELLARVRTAIALARLRRESAQREDLQRQVEERTRELQRAMESAFRERELSDITLKSIGDGVLVTDAAGAVIDVNRAAEQIIGRSLASLRGTPVERALRLVNRHTREPIANPLTEALGKQRDVPMEADAMLICADGREIGIEDSAAAIRNAHGDVVGGVLVFRDVSERRILADKVAALALHDPLTGLANRALLDDRLEQAVEMAGRRGERVGLVYIDLDGFKAVNDENGHAAGDALLREVAAQLGRCLRASDTACRVGGDEFIALLPNIEGHAAVQKIVEKMRRTVRTPFQFGGQDLEIQFSAGIAIYPDDAKDGRQLIQRADEQMYRAKSRSRNSNRQIP